MRRPSVPLSRLLAVMAAGGWLLLATAQVPAAAAPAGPSVAAIAARLRQDPVYVQPGARPTLDAATAGRLRSRIADSGVPVFVAVVSAQVRDDHGGTGALLGQLRAAVGEAGVYALVAGGQFRGTSDDRLGLRQRGSVLASAAFQAHRTQGVGAVLLDFVDRVRDAAPAAPASHTGTWVLLAVAALAAGVATLLVLRRGRLRQEQAAQAFSQVRAAAEQDLAALGTDVRELELDLDRSPAGGDATADYTVGVDWYQWASEAFDRAASVADFAQVSAAVEASGLALARARARLDGRPAPQRRPPCFFDPRHGPSVRDVAWAPPGGTVRPVPACAACAGLAEHGSEPLAREVLAGDQPVPLWAAPAAYAAWFAGHYGAAAGGLLTGLPLGEAVAAGWGGWSGGPGAYADTGVLAGGTPVGGDPGRDLGGGRP
jgi:hypothetical protein